MEFNSALAETTTRHPGANYFCVTKTDELKKTTVDDFDWNFFPAAFNVEVTFQSDSFDLGAVYGTPYDTQEEVLRASWHPGTHRFYPPDFKAQTKLLLLCASRYSEAALPMP